MKVKTLNDLIRSYEYDAYQGDTVLNLQYRIINEPNINEVTHQDIIDNWRDFLDSDILKLSDKTKDRINKEIDAAEQRHIEAISERIGQAIKEYLLKVQEDMIHDLIKLQMEICLSRHT